MFACSLSTLYDAFCGTTSNQFTKWLLEFFFIRINFTSVPNSQPDWCSANILSLRYKLLLPKLLVKFDYFQGNANDSCNSFLQIFILLFDFFVAARSSSSVSEGSTITKFPSNIYSLQQSNTTLYQIPQLNTFFALYKRLIQTLEIRAQRLFILPSLHCFKRERASIKLVQFISQGNSWFYCMFKTSIIVLKKGLQGPLKSFF